MEAVTITMNRIKTAPPPIAQYAHFGRFVVDDVCVVGEETVSAVVNKAVVGVLEMVGRGVVEVPGKRVVEAGAVGVGWLVTVTMGTTGFFVKVSKVEFVPIDEIEDFKPHQRPLFPARAPAMTVKPAQLGSASHAA